jgi:glucose-fructose oxidoreductase
MQNGKKISKSNKKIRYAVVGIGYISQIAVLPAFAHASKNSELTALVSSDPLKLKKLAKKYNVANTYSYEEFDDCLNSGEIDAVYIALPNNLHREYTVRAANAGIHVLCEKPMAVTNEDCKAMIEAVDQNNVKLMIAYRLHFEEANLNAIEIIKSGKIGKPRLFNSVFSQQVKDEENIRLKGDLGGGTLHDMGIYCINAARYLFQEEPIEVTAFSANNGEARFKEIDEMTSVIMRFPDDKLAVFTSSFGQSDSSAYQVYGTKGNIALDPAYELAFGLKYKLTIDGKSKEKSLPKRDHFAPLLLYFSDCILNDKQPQPDGREGLADVRVINALYQSAKTGKSIKLAEFKVDHRPSIKQEIVRPAVKKTNLVNAKPPSGE